MVSFINTVQGWPKMYRKGRSLLSISETWFHTKSLINSDKGINVMLYDDGGNLISMLVCQYIRVVVIFIANVSCKSKAGTSSTDSNIGQKRSVKFIKIK